MKNGDISNEVPKRILVVEDVFTRTTEITTKKFFFKKDVKINKSFDLGLLSKLYLVASNSPFTFEMVSVRLTEEELTMSFNNLDRQGTNPFRYWNSYKSAKDLTSALPFRPEVAFVVDIPSRKGQYGHWGLDITEL